VKDGWIKDYRQELQSDIWLMPPLYHRVWQYLKYKVNSEDAKIPMRDGSFMTIKKGQHLTSIRGIAQGVGWYEGRKWKEPNPKTIKTILQWMKQQGMIDVTAVKGNNGYTLITLINWEVYQSKSVHSNNEYPLEKQSTDINKKEKKDKKDDWMIEESDPTENIIREIENRFIQRRGRGTLLTAADIQSIHSLLNDRIPLDVILDGIDFAFDNYKKKHSRDGIKTFAYCETVIRDLYERRKVHAKRETSGNVPVHEGNPGENKPVTRGRVGWLNPRRRKEIRV